MASTIKLKNSTTAGNAPSSLETGEVAINVADGNLFYGSASAVLQNFVVDELQVKGNLTAQQYIVSSSVTYTTQSFSSGSTAFGDSADDTHVFTGNITASGDISASGTIIGSNLSGTNTGDQNISNLAITGSDVLFANITASGNISASGNIIGDTLTVNAISFPQDTNITIQTPDEDSVNGDGGNLTLEAGNGAGSNGDGGDLIFNAGKSSGGGDSGDIIFNTFGTTAGGGTSGSIILNGGVDATSVTSSKFSVGSGGQFSVGLSNPLQSRLKITSNGNDLGIFDSHGSNAGKLTIGNIVVSDGMDISGNITASGNISASSDITANSFTGDLTGNADTATDATNSTNVNVGNGDGSSTYYILGALGTGNQPLKRDNAITFNASSDTLNVGNLDSAGKIFIGTSNIELRGAQGNFIIYDAGLNVNDGHITASAGHFLGIHEDGGQGGSTYLKTSGDASADNLKLEFGDLDGNGNETKLIVDDNGNSIDITGDTDISGDLSISGISNVSESIAAAANSGGGGTTKMYLHSNFFLSTSETSKRYVPFNNAVDQSSINNYLSQVPVMNAGSVTKISIWPQASSTSFTIGIHKNANTTAIESVTQSTTAGTPITFTFSTNTFAALDEMAFSVTSNHTSNNGINMIIEFENS
jgi:hypothetical protein